MNNQPYFDLGLYRRPLSTENQQVQSWFNRGLLWCYGFNQEEAIRCFERSIAIDPDFAMGYWGIAYAAGPFYNKPWHWYGEQERADAIAFCHHHANQANMLKHRSSAVEQALISALCCKHPLAQSDNDDALTQWMHDYAEAMRKVYQSFPEDLDVICLAAESLLNLTPW